MLYHLGFEPRVIMVRVWYKVHLLFQELLGIGCLKSLLMLALLKRFPYTVLWKEVYFVIFGSKNLNIFWLHTPLFMLTKRLTLVKNRYANSIRVCQGLKEHTKTCLGSWKSRPHMLLSSKVSIKRPVLLNSLVCIFPKSLY